jgi:hypothetical protein
MKINGNRVFYALCALNLLSGCTSLNRDNFPNRDFISDIDSCVIIQSESAIRNLFQNGDLLVSFKGGKLEVPTYDVLVESVEGEIKDNLRYCLDRYPGTQISSYLGPQPDYRCLAFELENFRDNLNNSPQDTVKSYTVTHDNYCSSQVDVASNGLETKVKITQPGFERFPFMFRF